MSIKNDDQATTTREVFRLLEDLRKQHSLEPVKKLFWTELNYNHAQQALSRRDWPEKVARVLSEDPLLFATAGDDDNFHIIYARLSGDKLSLEDERQVVNQLLKNHLYSLFIFSNKSQDRWHFLNIKRDDRNEKRHVFRRISINPEGHVRTASERLAILNLTHIDPTLSNIPVLEIPGLHEQAFNVEEVTQKFFQQYHAIFTRVEGLIQGIDNAERKRLFTQRLFNRLMFIAFIQKKGWLTFNGQSDYLTALWNAYEQNKTVDSNFYTDRLELLFFTGLNTDNDVDVAGINPDGFLQTLIGTVPYLNGGLFEKHKDDSNAIVPDECIDAILHELFDHFNFTVTESTPLDIEVAVDPEMLGKVFEELVTGRHETGSYYTPKPVVSFMCREALKGYIQTKLSYESPEAIAQFVDEQNPQGLRNPEAVLDALRRVKVCDLACGSGAYLLGMLHELLDLRACLFNTKHLDPISVYQRKLEIIQNNVYGVDLDPFAVNIARLRLWLSLAVDYNGPRPRPLPNLDFKIEDGDSLIAPNPETLEQIAFRDELIGQYREAKDRYVTSRGSEKQNLKQQIIELRTNIATWTYREKHINGFDWAVEFAEVFTEGGFDIILANPPYVRADAQFKHLQSDEVTRQSAIAEWKKWRQLLRKSNIYQTLHEKWDLYIPFLERAYQLLQPDGQMVFIIPDAYNAAKYAIKSQEFFLENTSVRHIDFCSDIFLFAAGVNNTILHFAKTKPDKTTAPTRARRWGEKPSDFDINIEFLPTSPQAESGIALFKEKSLQTKSMTDNYLKLGDICYISVGMVINADEDGHKGTFNTDDVLSETQDSKHPKRFILGKDVMKWFLRNVRYLEWGTNRAPSHFRRPTFPQLHEAKEKLIAMRTPGKFPKVIYDDGRLYFDASSVGFVQWHLIKGVRNNSIRKSAKYRDELKSDETQLSRFREDLEGLSQQFYPKYLLALMNSTFVKEKLAKERQSNKHIYPDEWKTLPIPPATLQEQTSLVALVDKILLLFEQNGCQLSTEAIERLKDLEKEIDERVAALYGL